MRLRRWLVETVTGRAVCAAAFLLLLFVWLSIIAPFTGEICTYNEHADKEYCREGNLVIVALTHLFRFLDSTSTFVTAFATALPTWITWRLMRLEDDSGKVTKGELRAYVSATPSQIRLLPDDKTFEVAILIQNHGQTPAFKTQVFPTSCVEPFPMKEAIDLIIPVETRGVEPTYTCWPDREASVKAVQIVFTAEDAAKLDGGKHALFVVGRVEYLDTFGTQQWTNFCASLEPAVLAGHIVTLRSAPRCHAIPAGFKITQFNNDATFQLGDMGKS